MELAMPFLPMPPLAEPYSLAVHGPAQPDDAAGQWISLDELALSPWSEIDTRSLVWRRFELRLGPPFAAPAPGTAA
jgi:hypothetical protein